MNRRNRSTEGLMLFIFPIVIIIGLIGFIGDLANGEGFGMLIFCAILATIVYIGSKN